MNMLVITLNNGTTKEYISHKKNGLIYSDKEINFKQIANDLINLINNPDDYKKIKYNLKNTEKLKLWTWDERLGEEIKEVNKLIEKEVNDIN